MKLSIVIVNYNVRFFLEQCLESVFASDTECGEGRLELDVWVVDNDSVDDSVAMVRERFPQVTVIENKENVGFARANNQALRECDGDYVLLLNPDTLVERDTFKQCVDFIATHPDCGAMGVKMVDGAGSYLPESKRGFPTPATSFYKISGLIKLFPHSKRIAAYYMGHLSPDETNEIEILPGAYIMMPKAALDKVGLLDESYFMYGEDIDFSWRFILAGYKNYYLPSARIIHYKGESTKKGSMNYVYTFYNAMAIFTKKYFSGSNAKAFNALIHLAIWGRAALAFVKRLLQRIAVPLLDFAIAFGGFIAIKQGWAAWWGENVNYYPPEYMWCVIPLYIVILMAASFLYGGYDKPVKLGRIVKGMGIGAATLLVFYSLLDESQRYSRAILLLGSIWTLISTLGIRGLLSAFDIKGYTLRNRKKRACIIIGSADETARVKGLYEELGIAPKNMVLATKESSRQLSDLIHYHRAEEVIFCGHDLSTGEIISLMGAVKEKNVEYKIVPSESDFVIGSNTISSREDLYTEELNTIDTPTNRRNKRIVDLATALLLILLSPILFWFQRRKKQYFPDCFRVFSGRYSWVGYSATRGIFSAADAVRTDRAINKERIELKYARNYRPSMDLVIIWKNLFNI